jgi:lantibiotic biosynthesis protein
MKDRPFRKLAYEPLDFLAVRVPLLSVEAYLSLGGESDPIVMSTDPNVQRAMAIGSLNFFTTLERASVRSNKVPRLEKKLLRYLIRMSTRPTPYGMFAGIGLASWGKTDLALGGPRHRTRTRPDMEWLLRLIHDLESNAEVRRNIRFFVNPALYMREGRCHLPERMLLAGSEAATAVSIRATAAVQQVLKIAREPILYRELVERMMAAIARSDRNKVEEMISSLWQQTILLTALRPTLTGEDAAKHLIETLHHVPCAAETAKRLERLLDKLRAWDAMPAEGAAVAYRTLVREARELGQSDSQTPFQVDMALNLSGHHVGRSIGDEAAVAAELLIRQAQWVHGSAAIAPYRQSFLSRYGEGCEVPVLELFHPEFGLGPLPLSTPGTAPEKNRANSLARDQFLFNLAVTALRDEKLVISLDRSAIEMLQNSAIDDDALPPSLELFLFVAASSASAVDSGEFLIVVGPNPGNSGAGRSLGRFADMLGPRATDALNHAAQREMRTAPDHIWAELVYLPQRSRSANVAMRPVLRAHEIVWGVRPGVGSSRAIPLDELLIGVRHGRFYIRWPREKADVILCSGHLLNYMRAPAFIRSLAELSRDGSAVLHGFQWGSAASLPFQPRLQVGRIVLSLAQWRITPTMLSDPSAWRRRWNVPRYVYLSQNDNRLLLDLDSPRQFGELVTEVKRGAENGSILLQEALPGPEHAWVPGPSGRYFSEFVVPLVKKLKLGTPKHKSEYRHLVRDEPIHISVPSAQERMRLPGSDWLFAKFYGESQNEEALISGELRSFTSKLMSSGLIKSWHFIRYNDPGSHIRLRFHGDPELLTRAVWPQLCCWADHLRTNNFCRRFAIDTYEREIERYGGIDGLLEAEKMFFVDSCAAVELLYWAREDAFGMNRLALAAISIDSLLESLGVPERGRTDWCRAGGISRKTAGPEYREHGAFLLKCHRNLSDAIPGNPLESLHKILKGRSEQIAALARELTTLQNAGKLNKPAQSIYRSIVHLHCNRLLGTDKMVEEVSLGLVARLRASLSAEFSLAMASSRRT